MADSSNRLSLGKVSFFKNTALNLLMYLEPQKSYEFLFNVNHLTRLFLQHNYTFVERNFENEGLALKHINMLSEAYIYDTLM